ncbi:uncharacterized protein LOC113237974 [Hyposmocoma kahamanoa]|uniref:uncharacterized protein LOC113237974 n=1 Tax=Hyposmocoma kahamanoa TaxID=1477025 RepID=UPI000E6D92C5|nr:uncharacterized protein LOC113237974 [Hyposmocoma kahamanoa]
MARHLRLRHRKEVNDLIGIRIETVDIPASETKEYLEDVEQCTPNKSEESEEGGDEDSAQEEEDSDLEQVDRGTVLNKPDPSFEEKIKNVCTKRISERSNRRRSVLWNFYEELGSTGRRCKLCSKIMSKNMARHLRLKHPKVYQQMQGSLEKRKKPAYEIPKSYKCWVKKYCSKIDDGKYQCDICDKILSLPIGRFSNMKRHIRSKHPCVYDQEVNDLIGIRIETVDTPDSDTKEYLEDVEEFTNKSEEEGDENSAQEEADSELERVDSGTVLNEADPNFEEKIKYFCTKPVSGKKRASNPMWNFFETIEENHLYMCLGCNKQLSIYPHNIANLKRHIKMKHKKQYEYMMKYLTSRKSCIESEEEAPLSFDKYYFNLESEGQYKCKKCSEVIQSTEEDQSSLFNHIKDNHPDQILAYQEEENAEYNIVILKNDDVTTIGQ